MDASCQRCGKMLQTPFWKCIAGHPLCNHCSREVHGCPTCHASSPQTDSPALIALRGMQHLSCVNNYNKCPFTGSYEALKQHELTCPYSEPQFPCTLTPCGWTGNRNAFTTHVLSAHSLPPATHFRTGFTYDIHSASTSIEDWENRLWHALFTQENPLLGQKLYMCSVVCSGELLAVTVYALSQDPEPVHIALKAQPIVGTEQSPLQVYIGRTAIPGKKEFLGLTIGVEQLKGFVQHEYRRVEDTGANALVALVSVMVIVGEAATETLYIA